GTVGEWKDVVDISHAAILTASLGSFTTPQAAGVDAAKLNGLFNASKVEPQTSTDHHGQMTDQGIPFGTAQYPIHFNEGSGTYLRQGPDGQKQEWDTASGSWNDLYGSLAGYPKLGA